LVQGWEFFGSLLQHRIAGRYKPLIHWIRLEGLPLDRCATLNYGIGFKPRHMVEIGGR
jgi:hypothetical protein